MKDRFALTYILFAVAQMILSNYFHFTPYILLSILPALVLFIPTRVGTVPAMLIAFLTGIAVDYFAEGTLGINALSLVPVAFARRSVIEMLCGIEPFEHKESFSVKKYGFGRVSMAILMVTALFMLVYVLADCAGTRPFWFIMARIGLSTLCSYLVSILTINSLTHDDRR